MYGYTPAKAKASEVYEEHLNLLDEKTLSDLESDSGNAEVKAKYPDASEWELSARTLLGGLGSHSLGGTVLKIGFVLLPSFVQSRLVHDGRGSARAEKLGPTAYLDGMRGLAAFFVFFCHYFYTCFIIAEGWGYSDHNYHILKLPFIRLFYSGPPMVCIFFVISGYALSLKPLKLIRQRNYENLQITMSSFAFRRAIRLYLPTAISTFMIALLIQFEVYDWTSDIAYDDKFMKNVQETHGVGRQPTLPAQIADWMHNMFNFVHIWGWEKFGGSTAYDVHLWTIPVEFRASMLLFITIVAVARLRTAVRFLVMAGIMYFVYLSNRWEALLFYSGMILAELDLIRNAHNDPSTTATAQPTLPEHHKESILTTLGSPPLSPTSTSPLPGFSLRRRSRLSTTPRTVLLSTLTILSFYLLSQPDLHSYETPGWVTLSSLIPTWFEDDWRYFQILGSIILIFSVARLPLLQKFFLLPPIQYLGKISYAIYLMHGPVIHTLGYAIERFVWMRITGTEGVWFNVGFVIASLVVVPGVVWAADLFWRGVDAPVVRFAKWIEGKCVVKEA